MQVNIFTSSKTKADFILAVANLYIKLLKLEKSKYTLTIGTKRNLGKDVSVNGLVNLVAPNFLYMQLDSALPVHELIITLAHEMVHVKQYAKGQLKIVKSKNGKMHFKWLGKKVNKNYFDLPWELDAFRRERIMANKVAQIVSKI